MKRTAINRKTPLTARKPLKKGRRKPQKARQANCRWRSPDYLAWVRARPCTFCGQPGSDAHHVIGLGWGLSGMALTAPDNYALPLCRPCHDEMHRDPAMQWMQPIWLMDTINAGLEQFAEGPIHDALQEALAFVREKTA